MRIRLEHFELFTAVQKFMALMEGPKTFHNDMFKHVRLEGRGDHIRLTLYTSSLEAEQHLYGVSSHDKFLIGVPSKHLFEIVKLLPASEVIFELSDKFEIKCGKIRYKLPYIREDIYPDMLPDTSLDIAALPYFRVSLSSLFADLGRVAFLSNQKNDRPFARGVVVRPKHLLATDGTSRVSLYTNEVIETTATILLPTESLSRGYRYFQGAQPGVGGVFIVTAESGHATDLLISAPQPAFLKLRLGAATIPFIEKSLPRGDYQSWTIVRRELLLSLQRALAIADAEFPRGDVEIFQGTLIVEARAGENYHREEISVSGNPEKVLFSVNFRGLEAIVGRIETERLVLRYYGPREPIVLTDENMRHFNAIQPIAR